MTNTQNRKKILIADTMPFIRCGLESLLNKEQDLKVVATAASGQEAIILYDKFLPDVIVLDLQIKDTNCIVTIKTILEKHPKASIIILSTHDGDADILMAVRCGAKGYVLKDEGAKELLQAIRTVLQGQLYIADTATVRFDALNQDELLTPKTLELSLKLHN